MYSPSLCVLFYLCGFIATERSRTVSTAIGSPRPPPVLRCPHFLTSGSRAGKRFFFSTSLIFAVGCDFFVYFFHVFCRYCFPLALVFVFFHVI